MITYLKNTSRVYSTNVKSTTTNQTKLSQKEIRNPKPTEDHVEVHRSIFINS